MKFSLYLSVIGIIVSTPCFSTDIESKESFASNLPLNYAKLSLSKPTEKEVSIEKSLQEILENGEKKEDKKSIFEDAFLINGLNETLVEIIKQDQTKESSQQIGYESVLLDLLKDSKPFSEMLSILARPDIISWKEPYQHTVDQIFEDLMKNPKLVWNSTKTMLVDQTAPFARKLLPYCSWALGEDDAQNIEFAEAISPYLTKSLNIKQFKILKSGKWQGNNWCYALLAQLFKEENSTLKEQDDLTHALLNAEKNESSEEIIKHHNQLRRARIKEENKDN